MQVAQPHQLYTYAFAKTSLERERHLEGVRTSLSPSERRFLSKRVRRYEYVFILANGYAQRGYEGTFIAFQPTNPPIIPPLFMGVSGTLGGLVG